MPLDRTFFRSKVARRIFILFICCAILPILALAALSLATVSEQLNEQSQKRLHQAAKGVGQSIIERLIFLEAELRLLRLPTDPGPVRRDHPRAGGQTGGSIENFRGVAVLSPTGPPSVLAGRLDSAISLTPAEWEAVRSGKSVVFARPRAGSPQGVYLAAAPGSSAADAPVLIGEVDPAYLWGTGEEGNLPSMTELSVIQLPDRILTSTVPVPADFAKHVASRQTRSGLIQFEWKDREEYVASAWPLFLQARFSAAPWVVVLSESKADVRAPLRQFYATFPAVIALALLLVFLLSMSQIRRSLGPLEKLREGTRRIAAQEFASRVSVASRDEFEELAASFNRMAEQLGKQFSALASAAEITQGVLSSLDATTIVNAAIGRVRDLCPCDGVAMILVARRSEDAARLFLGGGEGEGGGGPHPVRITPEEASELRATPRLAWWTDGALPPYLDLLAARGIRSAVLLPIFLANRLAGILALGYAGRPTASADDMERVRQLADQVGVALANARLIEDLDDLNWGALTALARAIDAKSPWTAGHSERVTQLALKMGRAMGFSRPQLDLLQRGGLLHDIGKIGIPPEILDKPGRLGQEELRVMREHPQLGARILEPITAYAEVIPVVRQHHEWFDGTGYPGGLAGEAISLGARIFAVADVYDALRSDRPYRAGMPQDQVVDYIRKGSGRQFDPLVVEAFLRVMAEDGPDREAADQVGQRT